MASMSIDAALAAPPSEVGALLTAAPEDQWYDRKSIRIQPRDLCRHLIAFGNAEGGVIVLGIQDRRVQGIDQFPAQVNALRQALFDCTHPPVRARIDELPCVADDGRDEHLLVIRVQAGERVHEAADGQCYLRVGDESRRLTFDQRRELEYDRGQSQYDGQPAAGVTANDLDAESVHRYGESLGLAPDLPRTLAARSLVTLDGRVTNAAYLLFAESPQQLFPEAYVRVLRFRSADPGTGARQDLEEGADLRVEGPIPSVIAGAQAAVEQLLPARRALGPSGRFEAVPIVPRDAWLEGLVNAVIHRSYSLAGDHIRVEIYPDRMEIESPGRFPGLVDPTNPLSIGRFARNPRIARVCADLRFGQELGEGIRRIFEEMRRTGLTDPVYRQTSGSVRLVLGATPRLDPRTAALLPPGSEQLLRRLREAGRPVGTGDIAAASGVSRPVVLRRLRALEQAGLVQWLGRSRNDPRAAWTVLP